MSGDATYRQPLRIPPRTEHLERVRSYIGNAITSTFLTAIEQNGVVLAVDEACANLIAHAVEVSGTREIEVVVTVTSQDIAIEIRDQTRAFDPRAVASPDMSDYFREMRSGGLGIALMRRVMDQIEYIPATQEAPFNRLILHKRHRSAS